MNRKMGNIQLPTPDQLSAARDVTDNGHLVGALVSVPLPRAFERSDSTASAGSTRSPGHQAHRLQRESAVLTAASRETISVAEAPAPREHRQVDDGD